jgi:hypothetical protein
LPLTPTAIANLSQQSITSSNVTINQQQQHQNMAQPALVSVKNGKAAIVLCCRERLLAHNNSLPYAHASAKLHHDAVFLSLQYWFFILLRRREFAIINYDNNIIGFDSLKASGTGVHQKWALINNYFSYQDERKGKKKSPAPAHITTLEVPRDNVSMTSAMKYLESRCVSLFSRTSQLCARRVLSDAQIE